jgi:enoyl-CoA hydratase/carnithine racemase
MADGGSAPLVLRQDLAAGIVRLTLNRPEARNSLSVAMLGALQAALSAIAADDRVRVVVLAAAGPVFSAGHDLREIVAHRADADAGRGFFTDAMQRCAAVMQAIVALPQPVIAEVQGVATAAGCQLVATCDLAVASEAARFCTPGVDIGLFCATPAVALSRAVPAKPAMEMLLTGAMIGAAEAQRIGLVNRVVPAAALGEATMQLAATIAARSAHTIRIGKAAFHRQRGLPLDEAYAHCAAVMVENLLAEDAIEGIGAFLAKRKPVWNDR